MSVLTTQSTARKLPPHYRGFSDLPREQRNRIYDHLLLYRFWTLEDAIRIGGICRTIRREFISLIAKTVADSARDWSIHVYLGEHVRAGD
jgi:hypothetical protein